MSGQLRHSALYVGRVRHRRFEPRAHAFEYPLFLVYLDLDELDAVFAGRWFWSARRPNLAWFDRRDHLGDRAAAAPRFFTGGVMPSETLMEHFAGPVRLEQRWRLFFLACTELFGYDGGQEWFVSHSLWTCGQAVRH